MSKTMQQQQQQQQGFDSLCCDYNKPDSKQLDLPASSTAVPPKLPTSHSGELSRASRPAHRRSVSAGAPLIYSGGANGGGGSGSGSSPTLLPTGNICPSGKILRPGLPSRGPNRTEVLGSGTGNYGRGNIVRGGGGGNSVAADSPVKRAMRGYDPEEAKRVGNEMYRSGNFADALALYDRAVAMSPGNAAYRSNRAAALTALGRLGEAVRECEEAVKLDNGYARAHKRLASLYLRRGSIFCWVIRFGIFYICRIGQVENSRLHLCLSGLPEDPSEEQKLCLLEKQLSRCADSRKIGDWKRALRESEAAIAVGADFSPQLVACKAEAYLKLHQLEDAESCASKIPKMEGCPPSCSQARFFGMIGEAYVHLVSAQVEMALGRFENAVTAAGKARLLDYSNYEVSRIVNTVNRVAQARSRGNELFSSGKFSDACTAYGEGLKYDNSNYVLYCNRAICWSKLGLWEQSVQDCNQALNIQPNYTKALLRRAASNAKLERWAEVVKDYQALKHELPNDNDVAVSLHQAQLALEKSRGLANGTKFGVEVEEISSVDKFKSAIASAGVSVVYFKETLNEQCEEISPFINTLCVRYPSVKFIKVDVEECLAIAKVESIRSVPTFKIYKNGEKVKEMFRPTHQALEDSVRKNIACSEVNSSVSMVNKASHNADTTFGYIDRWGIRYVKYSKVKTTNQEKKT
ncbi:inactive TPR repeat-containing thioredoxin TTL3-like isoform X2 [Lotus japonicus]|uniref:inactive TPR repeat-containing thioredoxin TTL3-like isoform X2 n=1 Tax=Lotus japonicus TaxID=34305 RepID=UPI00258B1CC0|nr:inactive TPR repeat-containing thioredoxin TTL3-like isoform X2 [Lotus japonicus]